MSRDNPGSRTRAPLDPLGPGIGRPCAAAARPCRLRHDIPAPRRRDAYRFPACRSGLARFWRERAQPRRLRSSDYYADIEELRRPACPRRPARIVGHSMGANVAMVYAGVRPRRVRGLVNLEGFGLPRTQPSQAPERIAAWLDEQRKAQAPAEYASVAELAARVAKRNPRLSPERAAFIAGCSEHAAFGWSRAASRGSCPPARESLSLPPRGDGSLLAPHRGTGAARGRRESELVARLAPEGGVDAFKALVPNLAIATVAGAGHMLHHDEPRAVARLVQAFFGISSP